MKRYHKAMDGVEAPDGAWVHHDDVEALVKGYEQRLSLIHWWSEGGDTVKHSPDTTTHYDLNHEAERVINALQLTGARGTILSALYEAYRAGVAAGLDALRVELAAIGDSK